MLSDLEQFYENKEEPIKSCLWVLREFILSLDESLADAWKYRMPFICYHNKMFCYLWVDKKTGEPYIGVVKGKHIDHPMLEQGNRTHMKILRIDPNEDLPLELIREILTEALTFYQ